MHFFRHGDLTHTPPKSFPSPARKRLFPGSTALPQDEEVVTLSDDEGAAGGGTESTFCLLTNPIEDNTAGRERIPPERHGTYLSLYCRSVHYIFFVQNYFFFLFTRLQIFDFPED